MVACAMNLATIVRSILYLGLKGYVVYRKFAPLSFTNRYSMPNLSRRMARSTEFLVGTHRGFGATAHCCSNRARCRGVK
jgi:hypothetical protein